MNAEFIKEQPACVAVGFLGKLDFTEGADLEKFIANPNLRDADRAAQKRLGPGRR